VTAVVLVETLRARGVHLRAVGDKIRYRPISALTPEDLEALRQHKAEVLALLTRPPAFMLDTATVREVLGRKPNTHDLAILKLDVLAAVARLEAEIRMGTIGSQPLLVRGIPLGLWVDLAEVARLLRAGQRGTLSR
jgi:hypothetical protein